ncbi:MAG: GNAT family N-acetyltransferase [Clostridia bacterium]|nr:GNAT family N-acetyltransferase [Clostridia bacterium]
MKHTLLALFRRNFPFARREEETALAILENPENRIFVHKDDQETIVGAAVVHKNNVLLLCVDEPFRNRGIGTKLLTEAEAHVKNVGYTEITIGAGDDYLCPGVPVKEMPFEEIIENIDLHPLLPEKNASYYIRRGYIHAWGDCNCFDMHMPLTKGLLSKKEFDTPGILYRFARLSDIPAVLDCVIAAHPDFADYYREEDSYEPDSVNKILIALDGELVVGTLMVDFETEGEGVGSIGCTTVRPSHQGRKIAANMILKGAKYLYENGMREGFLGYTYSGLDKLYGIAGYRVCAFYFMAKKLLA